MAGICELCGKGPHVGHTVSRTGTRGWVKKRSKRWVFPNLRVVRVTVGDSVVRMRICARCLKSKKVTWSER